MTTPSGPEFGVKYTLTGPDGTIAVFNEPLDANFVGAITEITGLDSPEVRENAENITGQDGGVHGQFFYGRRPITIAGTMYKVASNTDRNEKATKILGASNALRADATLTWTPAGGQEQFVKVRRQQPSRITGGWIKDFQLLLVAADPRIYSVEEQDSGLSTNTAGYLTGLNAEAKLLATVNGFAYGLSHAGKLQRAEISANNVFSALGASTVETPTGITGDASTNLYWLEIVTGKLLLMRAPVSSGTSTQLVELETGPNSNADIAVDSAHVYWGAGTGFIGRCTLSGGTKEATWCATNGGAANGLAYDSNFMYFTSTASQYIGRVKLDGTGKEPTWLKLGAARPSDLVTNGKFIWWTDAANRKIGRVNVAGTNIEENFILTLGNPEDLAINAGWLMVAEHGRATVGRYIMEPLEINNRGNMETNAVLEVSGTLENLQLSNGRTDQRLVFEYDPLVPNAAFALMGGSGNFLGFTTDGVTGYTGVDSANYLFGYILSNPFPGTSFSTLSNEGAGAGLINRSLCLDNTYIYYAQMEPEGPSNYVCRILRVSRTAGGNGTTIAVYTGLPSVVGGAVLTDAAGITTDGTYVWWVVHGATNSIIGRALLGGGSPETKWKEYAIGLMNKEGAVSMANDTTYLYYAHAKAIGRYNKSSGAAEHTFIARASSTDIVLSVAVIGSTLWFSTLSGGLYKVPAAGPESSIVQVASGLPGDAPRSLVAVGNTLYWMNGNGLVGRLETMTGVIYSAKIDLAARTITLTNGESVYRALNFSESEWWQLMGGKNCVSVVTALYSEWSGAPSMTNRSAWI